MKFFQKVKEIRSKAGALHFQRYAIFETSLVSLYIHRIFKADEDRYMHNHPWNFLTMILWGSYVALESGEQSALSLQLNGPDVVAKGPGSVSYMDRDHFHRILSIRSGPVTTLFLAFGKKKPWGYLVHPSTTIPYAFVDSQTYREEKNKNV